LPLSGRPQGLKVGGKLSIHFQVARRPDWAGFQGGGPIQPAVEQQYKGFGGALKDRRGWPGPA